MINLSTNCNEFFENSENDLLMIYSAGTNAEIIVDLPKKANIQIECVIDNDIKKSNHFFNGIKILAPNDVENLYKNNKKKILVTSNRLLSCIHTIESNITNVSVYIPKQEVDLESFNAAIAPLRHKLLKTEDFTIIANTCDGTRIYQLLNCSYNTPFIGNIIKPNDFYKLCSNLKYYMKQELKFVRIEEWMYPNKPYVLCTLGDIEIKFISRVDFDDIKQKWDERVKRINYDNLFFIWEDFHYETSYDIYEKFLNIPYGKKLILQRGKQISGLKHSIYDPDKSLFSPGYLVEKWFNLIGFINNEVEY